MLDSQKLIITAPAKINLYLKVLDKRPDGFHNLDSVFLALDFGDTLHFEPVSKRGFSEISMEWSNNIEEERFPAEKNLIFKALSLFKEKTGFSGGLKIKAEKRIPAGSGLGGGSSDAAAALLALNKIAGLPLSRAELLQLAASLGSDVPFFIYRIPAAKISGRGEHISPIDAPFENFVLVYPGFKSDTAASFKLLDNYRKAAASSSDALRNDFLECANEPDKSVYYRVISALKELGAYFAGLSGTGSVCFGVFKEKAEAKAAVKTLREDWEFIECCGIFNGSHCEHQI